MTGPVESLGPAVARRDRRVLAWRLVLALALVGTVAAFVLARQVRTPGEIAARAEPPPPSQISVPVERLLLEQTVTVRCGPRPAFVAAIGVQGVTDSADRIVTGLPVGDGDPVQEGDVALEVAARPVVVLRGRLPMFRELRPGAVGPDVRQLQAALRRLGFLRGEPDGRYGAATGEAVEEWYGDLGYPAATTSPGAASALRSARRAVARAAEALHVALLTKPVDRAGVAARRAELEQAREDLAEVVRTEGPVVPRGELAFLPQVPATLEAGSLVLGQPVPSAGARLTSGEKVLGCALGDVAAEAIDIGDAVRVATSAGETVDGSVAEIRRAPGGNGDAATADGVAAQVEDEVVVTVDAAADELTEATADVVVETAPAPALVVPTAALWERAGGTTVVRVARAAGTEEVVVDVGFEADGLVAVTPAGRLDVGESVLLGARVGGQGGG